MSSAKKLLQEKIVWEAVFEEGCSYRSKFNGVDCIIIINSEFPAGGPFYKLLYQNDIIEFDDPPPSWVMPSPNS